MVDPFPPINLDKVEYRGQDRNPAVQLFGRRFFVDQTVPELLLELLLVATSLKRVGNKRLPSEQMFPDIELLQAWPNRIYLEYAAKARLNLKLFAFLGASKLETRHESHRQHYRSLLNLLQSPENLAVTEIANSLDVLQTLENLFLGFLSVGEERTWCAQSFLPVARNLVAGESIWRETGARHEKPDSWDRALKFFSHSQQLFLSRGGEVLYLQLCNALRQEEKTIQTWASSTGLNLSSLERNPVRLREALERGFSCIFDKHAETVGKLAAFIDSGIDTETSQRTDMEINGEPHFTKCGWCPTESWSEGLLFAVELFRLCEAKIDPIERLELLEIACAMQVLRSLCAQSARHIDRLGTGENWLGFFWVLSDPDGQNDLVKRISRRSVNAVLRMVYAAIRHPEILKVLDKQKQMDASSGRNWRDPYREADSRYGYKLFLTMAKRIGLIVPKRGIGARFVLNNRILRFLVMSVIPPGKRFTYETFKKLLFAHYGIAIDDERISQACEWCGTGKLTTLGGTSDVWLVEMLEEAGVLVQLSDSCSLVANPFDGGEIAL